MSAIAKTGVLLVKQRNAMNAETYQLPSMISKDVELIRFLSPLTSITSIVCISWHTDIRSIGNWQSSPNIVTPVDRCVV